MTSSTTGAHASRTGSHIYEIGVRYSASEAEHVQMEGSSGCGIHGIDWKINVIARSMIEMI